MSKTLLRGNQRIGYLLGSLAGGVLLAGLLMASALPQGWRLSLTVIAGLAATGLAVGAWLCLGPRLGIDDQGVLVYLRLGTPIRVPLSAVEVFFIGQGAVAGGDPGQPVDYEGAVAANVIVRIAEGAGPWHQRDIPLALGVWRDGYITLRGLWCENIDSDVLKRMNQELMTFKRKHRSQAAK